MKQITLIAIGKPAPEPRPRSRGQGRGVYVPANADEWKQAVRASALAQGFPKQLTSEALAVHIHFLMPRPKSHFRSGRFAGQLKPKALCAQPTGKPDGDNLLKAAVDALGPWKGPTLVWVDDSQIVDWRATQAYCGPAQSPGAVILIRSAPIELQFATLFGLDRLPSAD